MVRFVIADISDAKSVLQELCAIVPELPSVPVQSVIVAAQAEPGMFDFHRKFPWFLPVHRYDTPEQLLADLSDRVIGPAEAKIQELVLRPRRPRARGRTYGCRSANLSTTATRRRQRWAGSGLMIAALTGWERPN
jgi:hypothetical protein